MLSVALLRNPTGTKVVVAVVGRFLQPVSSTQVYASQQMESPRNSQVPKELQLVEYLIGGKIKTFVEVVGRIMVWKNL